MSNGPYVGEQGWAPKDYPGSKSGNPYDQYLRKWTLSLGHATSLGETVQGAGGSEQIVVTTSAQNFDLRMRFQVRHADYNTHTPGQAEITVYNLKRATAASIIQEFNYVTLQAGYETGRFGIIFAGTIKQFKRGRENATDSYLTIFASDGDAATGWGVTNFGLPAGWSSDQLRDQFVKIYGQYGIGVNQIAVDPKGFHTNARPYISSAMLTDEVANYAATTQQTWTVQNGGVQIQQTNHYMPGDVPVINATTGLIGVPELTDHGLQLTCLLNPELFIKQQIQIDNDSVNETLAVGGAQLWNQTSAMLGPNQLPGFWVPEDKDGRYMILVIDHEGDTRGQEWYSHIIATNVNPTNPTDPAPAMTPKDGTGNGNGNGSSGNGSSG